MNIRFHSVAIRFTAAFSHRDEAVAFIQKMANRLCVGQYRHGEKGSFNRIQDYRKRLQDSLKRYDQTGNTEFLIDAANYALLEFHNPLHPNAHYSSTDSNGRTE